MKLVFTKAVREYRVDDNGEEVDCTDDEVEEVTEDMPFGDLVSMLSPCQPSSYPLNMKDDTVDMNLWFSMMEENPDTAPGVSVETSYHPRNRFTARAFLRAWKHEIRLRMLKTRGKFGGMWFNWRPPLLHRDMFVALFKDGDRWMEWDVWRTTWTDLVITEKVEQSLAMLRVLTVPTLDQAWFGNMCRLEGVGTVQRDVKFYGQYVGVERYTPETSADLFYLTDVR